MNKPPLQVKVFLYVNFLFTCKTKNKALSQVQENNTGYRKSNRDTNKQKEAALEERVSYDSILFI